jgi:hypothetical protein
MVELLTQILMGAYASVGVIATVGYVPTIKDLIKQKMVVNTSSYAMWTFCSGTAFLYSMTLISDLLLQVVNGLNFACCALVLALSLYVKYNG